MADSVLRLPSFHSLRLSSSSSSSSCALVNFCNTQHFIHNFYSDKKISSSSSFGVGVSRYPISPRKHSVSFKVHAAVAETEPPKWWEKIAGPNMIDVHSTQEFLSALSQAGDRLVIVEFYGTWCASCRALFPKLCRTAEEHPEILFLKVNFDENKPMCKSLNVKVLPYFHFYRGSHGQLDNFSCSLAKFQKIKDAISMHSKPNSIPIHPAKATGELTLESLTAPTDKSG